METISNVLINTIIVNGLKCKKYIKVKTIVYWKKSSYFWLSCMHIHKEPWIVENKEI